MTRNIVSQTTGSGKIFLELAPICPSRNLGFISVYFVLVLKYSKKRLFYFLLSDNVFCMHGKCTPRKNKMKIYIL